jgi:exonuclease VII small subunit
MDAEEAKRIEDLEQRVQELENAISQLAEAVELNAKGGLALAKSVRSLEASYARNDPVTRH